MKLPTAVHSDFFAPPVLTTSVIRPFFNRLPSTLSGQRVRPQGIPLPVIQTEEMIRAPIEVVFDLSRSIDLHVESTRATKEIAIAGRTSGLLELDEQVTWQATHFGVRQKLTVKLVAFDRPNHFRDSMVSGVFARFDHDHYFETVDGQTRMIDVFDYTAPLGFLGRIADTLFLKSYITLFLQKRNAVIKQVAESDQRDRYLLSGD